MVNNAEDDDDDDGEDQQETPDQSNNETNYQFPVCRRRVLDAVAVVMGKADKYLINA